MFSYKGRTFFSGSFHDESAVAYDTASQKPAPLTPAEERAAVIALREGKMAMFYVWGREDAGEMQPATDTAQRFGEAFAAHAYAFHVSDSPSMVAVQNAFRKWRQIGRIER